MVGVRRFCGGGEQQAWSWRRLTGASHQPNDVARDAGVPAATVLGASACAALWWLRELTARGRPWLVAARQDRRLRIGADSPPFGDGASTLTLTRLATRAGRGTTIWAGLLSAVTR